MKITNTDENKISFKIQALIAKAESTDSQAEKDAFMMKAQELIQKHNLDSQRIMGLRKGSQEAGDLDENIIEEHVKYESEWDRKLMQNISESSMCTVIFNSSQSQIYIIGKETNVNSVVFLANFYRKAILNLAIESAKRKSLISKGLARRENKGRDLTLAQINRIQKEEQENISDYLFGAVDGLKDAMKNKEVAFRDEVFSVEDGSQIRGGEIIRLNRDRVAEYIKEKYPRLGSISFRGGGNSNSASYSRGFKDGSGFGASQRRLG